MLSIKQIGLVNIDLTCEGLYSFLCPWFSYSLLQLFSPKNIILRMFSKHCLAPSFYILMGITLSLYITISVLNSLGVETTFMASNTCQPSCFSVRVWSKIVYEHKRFRGHTKT